MASKKHGRYRSGLEKAVAKQIAGEGSDFEYETIKVPFVQPAKDRRYTVDFILPNGIVVETKGRWTTADRQKFIFITDAWPDLDLRFVFSNPNSRISKRSKTTYAKYCDRKGWRYSSQRGTIPSSWITEKPNRASIRALNEIRNHRLNK